MNSDDAAEDRADSPLRLYEGLTDVEQALPRFARWMYRTARGHLGHSVLDAGAGIGTHTELLLGDGHEVVAVEANSAFVRRLHERFPDSQALKIFEGDLAAPGGLGDFLPVDSAICLNVIEHIVDDVQSLKNIGQKVRPGGSLVALVPAHPWLYNNLDRAIGHHRR
jgi:SAM-dependent methyltransferase